MRALLQRVRRASVTTDGQLLSEIGLGLCVLLGVGPDDSQAVAAQLARKCAELRIFEDASGKMNLSLLDAGGAALVVSQFTLYADTSRGRRPGFSLAATPDIARPLVESFVEALRQCGVEVKTGIFGTDMLVEIHNDGPVTIWLDSSDF